MSITEFATIVFKSPPTLSDSILLSLFQKLSAWQSECSSFPMRFFIDLDNPLQLHLVTGWESVETHEAWIRGERNQELLRVFAPYVDIPKIRMVHLDVDFEAIPKDVGWMVVERYEGQVEWATFELQRSAQSLFGKDLAHDGGDIFRFRFGVGECPAQGAGESNVRDHDSSLAPAERWSLKVWHFSHDQHASAILSAS